MIEIEIAAPALAPCFAFDARAGVDPGPLPIGPPLLVVADRPLTLSGTIRIRAALAEALREGPPIVFDPTLEVFQLVGGRWVPLKPEPPRGT